MTMMKTKHADDLNLLRTYVNTRPMKLPSAKRITTLQSQIEQINEKLERLEKQLQSHPIKQDVAIATVATATSFDERLERLESSPVVILRRGSKARISYDKRSPPRHHTSIVINNPLCITLKINRHRDGNVKTQ